MLVQPPKIEFPCDYPIKIIGTHQPDFRDQVIAIVRRFAPETRDEDIEEQLSRKQNYISVRVTIRATGEQQLQAMFVELKKNDLVSMVL